MAWSTSSRSLSRFTFFLLMTTTLVMGEGPKLNVPHVLLPFVRGEPLPAFRLVVSNVDDDDQACFKWNSTQPKMVSVRAESSSCSRSAWVSSSSFLWSWSTVPDRVHALITAERVDSPSSEVLRANVILAVIDSLTIITHTHRLYLEEAPEEFIVRARDKEGNQFSTLKGINFTWSINNVESKEDKDVKKRKSRASSSNVRFMDPESSNYYFLEHSNGYEETRGPYGTRVLLEGTRAGAAVVSVCIDSSRQIGSAEAASVVVRVLANVALQPSLVRVIPGGRVGFLAEEIKNGKAYNIELENNEQYLIDVDNVDVAKVAQDDGAVVVGLDFGRAEVVLVDASVDRNLEQGEVVMPTSVLYVVRPHFITIGIGPVSSWHTTVNKDCYVYVDLFDVDDNLILPSDNLDISFDFLPEEFERDKEKRDAHVISGRPRSEGSIKVVAKLLGIVEGARLESPLVATAYLQVHQPIIVQPAIAVVAWHPLSYSFAGTVTFTATGGSGRYEWFSSEYDVASITRESGVASSSARVIGSSTITASMADAPHNNGSALLKVLVATGVEICTDTQLEAQVEDLLYLPLFMWASDGKNDPVKVDHCQNVQFNVNIDNEEVFEVSREQNGEMWSSLKNQCPHACSVLTLKARKPGFTSINVEVDYSSTDASSPRSRSLTIGAYEALRLVQPSEGFLVLGPDSSLEVVWAGGPLMWPLGHQNKYIERIAVDSQGSVMERRLKTGIDSKYKVFRVSCVREAGSTSTLTFTVGNGGSSSLRHPVLLQSDLAVYCEHPQQLKLRPRLKLPSDTANPCPVSGTDPGSLIPISATSDLKVDIDAYDSENRLFHNFSTEHLRLAVSNIDLASWVSDDSVQYENKRSGEDQEQKRKQFTLPEQAYQILSTKEKEGFITVSAVLKTSELLGLTSLEDVQSTLSLQLVLDVTVDKPTLSILLHPSFSEIVSVQRGSGYFELSSSASNTASINYDSKRRSVTVKPLAEGQVTTVLRDLCIGSGRSKVILKVSVSKIEGAKVELESQSVQQGDAMEARVVLVNKLGQALSCDMSFIASQLTSLNPEVVAVTRVEDKSNLFKVKGLARGEALLLGSIDYSAKDILKSTPVRVQVYNSLRLEPRNVTLIKGAIFQVEIVQGPVDSIEFSLLNNDEVVKIDNEGLITALVPGSTTLIARSYSEEGNGKARRLLSMDSITVHVIVLKGVKINVPVKEIEIGSVLPVNLVGQEDSRNQNLFAFGTAQPSLQITWRLSPAVQNDVASLLHPWQKCLKSSESSRKEDKENDNARRLVAKKAGRVTVKVEVKFSSVNQFASQGLTLEDEVDITIVEGLTLSRPSLNARESSLLLTPNSKFQLQTNFDLESKVYYQLLSKDTVNNVITVSKSGLISSKSVTGFSVVVVESEDKFGFKQSLIVNVQVRAVAYVMADVHCDNTMPSVGKALALGSRFSVKLSYHDQWGHVFDGVSPNFISSTRPSRFDSTVSNASTEFATVTEDLTVLRVMAVNKEERFEDFITLDVKQAPLLKSRRMSRGQVAKVRSDVVVVNDEANERCEEGIGEWQVRPNDLAQVINGFVVALRPGVGHVILAKEHDKIANELVVIETTNIIMDWPSTKRSSYYGNAYQMLVPFHINTVEKVDIVPLGETKAIESVLRRLYTCKLESVNNNSEGGGQSLLNLFTANPVLDPELNSLGCLIRMENQLSALEVTKALLRLSVEMKDNGVRSQTTVQFRGPLVIVDERREVELSTTQLGYNIDVLGSPEVLKELVAVVYNGANFLSVVRHWPRNNNHSHALFSFKLDQSIFDQDLFDMKFKPSVKLVSHLTGEEIEIEVKIVMDKEQKPNNYYSRRIPMSDFSFKLLIGVLLGVFAAVLYASGLLSWLKPIASKPRSVEQSSPSRQQQSPNGTAQSVRNDLIELGSPKSDHSWLNTSDQSYRSSNSSSPGIFSTDDHAHVSRRPSAMRSLTSRRQ